MEGIVVAAGGAVLGGLALLPFGTIAAVIGAVVAGAAGAFSGYRRIYHWRTGRGWAAFVLDSTWGLIGTTVGLLLHVANLFWQGAEYRPDCARRQNRHVYFGGAAFRPGFAFTHGNVMSNADSGRGLTRPLFLERHEGLHIWQSRLFGPLFQIIYLGWMAVGAVAGAVVWLFNRQESFFGLVETGAYYDNPFEYWAYRNDDHWRPGGVIAKLAWPDA